MSNGPQHERPVRLIERIAGVNEEEPVVLFRFEADNQLSGGVKPTLDLCEHGPTQETR